MAVGVAMNRAALTCPVLFAIVSLTGCSANPAYEPLSLASMLRFRWNVAARTAIKSARDPKSLKKAAEVLVAESDVTDKLREKIILLGKPNSASKTAVQKYLDELKALDKERAGAGDQYVSAVEKLRISNDERAECNAAGFSYAESVGQLQMSLSILFRK